MFDWIWQGIKSSYGTVKGVTQQVVGHIPVLGPPVVAGISAVEVLLGGGGVTITDRSGQDVRYGSAASPGVGRALGSMSIMGVPVLYLAVGGLVAWFVFKKKGR